MSDSPFSWVGPQLGHSMPRGANRRYAFTEFTDFEFEKPVDLEDETMLFGQIWAEMIKLYSSQEGVSMLWWGRRFNSSEAETPQVIKLIVDWKSREDRKQFLDSPDFADLYKRWQSCPVPFLSSDPSFFALNPDPGARENVFELPSKLWHRPGKPSICVLITFQFPSTFNFSKLHVDVLNGHLPPRDMTTAWEYEWVKFRQVALKTEGGITASNNTEGWSVGDDSGDGLRSGQGKSFIGVFRFEPLENAQKFWIGEAQDENPNQIHELGGLLRLRKFAGRDLTWHIEFVEMMGKRPEDPHIEATNIDFAKFGKLLSDFEKSKKQ